MKTIFIALVTAVATFLGTTLYYDYNTANPTVHIGDYSYTVNPMALSVEVEGEDGGYSVQFLSEADMNKFLSDISFYGLGTDAEYVIDMIKTNSEIVISDTTGEVSLEVRDDGDNVMVTVDYEYIKSGVQVGDWSTLTPSKF